jgi:hypothetical protein
MRVSDVNPVLAQVEFEKAIADEAGYIAAASEDAYVKYIDGPFTLYDGSRELDFRVNALGEILYGQDATSPSFVCSTFFNMMQDNNDPRLYRICRHYINTKRSEISPDREWNVDLTDEVLAYIERIGEVQHPCNPGAAWWNNWINAPANSEIPTLEKLVAAYPDAGLDGNNFPARMMRPALSIDFEQPACPGFLLSSAEVSFLLAEAKSKGWAVNGEVQVHFEAGITAAMQMLNTHYLQEADVISETEIADYIAGIYTNYSLESNAREAINAQAWVLHLMNPAEAWANLRRSDYPVLMDRNKLDKFESDFTYDDSNLTTPVRLRYPVLEGMYNSENYNIAIERLGGSDDWHKRMWWDKYDINVE